MKDIQYLAGLFDGEGSFSIQVGLRTYKGGRSAWFNPSMSMHLYYGSSVLEHFVERFGGSIYTHAKGGSRWNLGQRVAVLAAARSLEPHLEIKRHIAQRFIAAVELFPSGKGADRRAGERVWTPELSAQVAEIALTLNPPRSRKSNKTAECLAEMRKSLDKP